MSSNPGTRHFPVPRAAATVIAVVLAITILAAPTFASRVTDASKRLRGPGVVFGAHIQDNGPGYLVDAHKRLEERIGQKIRAARVYFEWDSKFPNEYATWLKKTGRTMVMSIKSRRENGSIVPWRDIANAKPGSGLYSTMVSWARRIKAYDKHVYLIFNHEPEVYRSDAMGSPDAFVAAFRKIVTVFRKQNVHNVSWTWTMTDWAFEATDEKAASKWYPGDRYVDVIGADVYNFYNCSGTRGWAPVADKLRPIRAWAKRHPGKPIILPEWASTEDPNNPGRKAQWIRDARALLKKDAWRRFKMVFYFESVDGSHAKCNWPVTSSGSALSAFADMARDPYYDKTG